MFNDEWLPQSKTKTAVLQQRRRRIGILGGTFNPVHIGHLVIADQVQNQLGLDQVLLMPDCMPPHVDKKTAIDATDRLNMLSLAIKDSPKMKIETAEIDRGGVSYTFDTMKEMTKKHPENEYYFIIGGDMVAYLPKWYRVHELFQLVRFVGVRRHGYSRRTDFPLIWVDVPEISISSTLIRKKVMHHQSIRYLVPKVVEDYIKERRLYE